ncbi:MAG: AsmA family protein, partial [Acidobacteria bacterium]|nr:AsmA family protein [Acidobacteriota bacterium]
MSRIPRWLRITLYVLVPLLLIAWIVPYFIDADRYRPDIVSAIEKETGRKASIGKITARLIPSVGFVIENISLGNPPGFPEGNFASVDRVKGSLAWGPLIFRKEFQLKAIEVVHPVVTLLEDENGRVNYDFAAKPGKAGSSTSSGMPGNFRIADVDSIRLTDAEIIMAQVGGRKRTAVAWLKATKLNVDLSNIALDIKKIKQWGADIDLGGAELWMSGIKGNIEFKSGEFKLRDGKAHADFKAAIGKAATGKGTLHVDDIEKAVAVFDISTPLLDVDQLMDSKAEEPPFATRITKSELVAQGKFAAD